MPAKEGFMSRTNIRFALCLTLIGSIAAVVPASAQHFEQMKGASLTQIAAGRNEVWGLNGSEVYRFNSSTEKFAKVSVPNKGQGLTQIAVGGGTLLQKDEVWGVDVNGVGGGPVYHFNWSTNKFDEYAGGRFGLSQIVVGPGYEDSCHPYEVWGIVVSTVFPQGTWRYNYCTSGFESITNPSGIDFSQIATGGGDIWAVSLISVINDGITLNTWEYLPPYGGWALGGTVLGTSLDLSQVAVGASNVWAIAAEGNQACAGTWGPIDTVQYFAGVCYTTAQVATGADGAWILYNNAAGNGLIGHWDAQQGVPVQFQLTSPAVQVAVGSGAGVWAIDSENRVYTFVRP
jgi:hypothetical protein